jgi:hypothetical protein
MMRKVYLAVLSLFGLAGSTVPAQAQILKGKEPDTAKASTVKSTKTAQENAAAKDAASIKYRKTKAAAVDAGSKDAAKMTKSTAEKNATKVQLENKRGKANSAQYPIEHGKEVSTGVSKDALTVKQKTAAGSHTADVVNEKRAKSAAEKNAGKATSQLKMKKNSAATSTEHAIGEKRDKAIHEKNATGQTPK